MRRNSMFLRIVARSTVVRRQGTLTALLATAVAAAVVTTMLTLYADVGAKLQREFRAYGANLIATTPDARPLSTEALQRIQSLVNGRGIAVPYAYVIAKTSSGASVVVAGTDLQKARQVNPWWNASAWPSSQGAALIGGRALPSVAPDRQPFELSFQGKSIRLSVAGVIKTGGDEDSRVYISLPDMERWAGLRPSSVEIAATGEASAVEALRQQLAAAVPEVEIKPVRQVVEAEARVLGKTRGTLLSAAVLIIVTAGLCVLATLTAWITEQRKNVAVMKALGGSSRTITALFGTQVALLGGAGAVLGFGIGAMVAMWIGRANFHASIVPHGTVFPVVLVGSIAVALLAAVFPMSFLRRLQPADILRGE